MRLQLAEAVGVELVREELIGQYVQLLKDNEAEVRTAAAGQIPGKIHILYFQALALFSSLLYGQASPSFSTKKSSSPESYPAYVTYHKTVLSTSGQLSPTKSVASHPCLARTRRLSISSRSSCTC
jgi:hypothetical protein